MKNRLIISVLLCSLMLTACGGASDEAYFDGGVSYNVAETAAVNSTDSYASTADRSYSVNAEESEASSSGAAEENGVTSEAISKEMLVYSCNMSVDVLNFDEAIGKFKDNIDSYGGFVETENFSDGGGASRWYIENEERWKSYSATVRIPSAQYDSFCTAASELGDLRSKNASVQNVSAEYSDLNTTLQIYEAKEDRYIALLSSITDEEYAITVERELTDLQIEIAKIKTRMNEIRTDVAYSFVNITINEVKEYTAEPVQKDTFGQRLKITISDTAENFLYFLEEMLFFIIAVFPYLILIGIVVIIVVSIRKHKRKKREMIIAAEMNKDNNTDK